MNMGCLFGAADLESDAERSLAHRRDGLELDRKNYLEEIATLERAIDAVWVNVKRRNAEIESLNSTILYLVRRRACRYDKVEDPLPSTPPQRPAASAARADS